MIKESLQSFFRTVRSLFDDKRSLAIFAGLYALLLGTLYGFIAIREATVWQVSLTLLFIALAPVLFFLLQAAIINRAQAGRIEWPGVLRASTKLALATIPIVLIGLGMMWLLNRWQQHFPAPFFSPPVQPVAPGARQPVAVPPIHWPDVLFTTARALIFGVVLPLALIQLWIEAARKDLMTFFRGGLRAFFARLGEMLGRAFAMDAVVVYALGLVVFALIPYVLLFVRIPTKGVWSEIAIFSVRLVLVFTFILLGWVITLTTFAKRHAGPDAPLLAPISDEPSPNQTSAVDESEMAGV